MNKNLIELFLLTFSFRKHQMHQTISYMHMFSILSRSADDVSMWKHQWYDLTEITRTVKYWRVTRGKGQALSPRARIVRFLKVNKLFRNQFGHFWKKKKVKLYKKTNSRCCPMCVGWPPCNKMGLGQYTKRLCVIAAVRKSWLLFGLWFKEDATCVSSAASSLQTTP